jgi:nitrate reductase gamma subunit
MPDTTLLEFARGPALTASLIVFALGVTWRLVGIFLLPGRRDLSRPRRSPWPGLKLIALRSWPRPEFLKGTVLGEVMGYAFHIGYFVVVLFLAQHVLFFEDLTGLSWPALPTGLITVVSFFTFVTLVGVLVHRIANPVKRMLSNFDDYFSWFVTALPLATGFLAYSHAGGFRYPDALAAHILSFELLLIWFPFGKLMHAFLIFGSRATEGTQFERKGAAL